MAKEKKQEMKFDSYGATMCAERAMEYEECTPEQQQAAFGYLVKTGLAWSLQGWFGRRARYLIENGYLDSEGNVLKPMINHV